MIQSVLFNDLGNKYSYKEIWDLQEMLLQQNVRLKAEGKRQELGDRRQESEEGNEKSEVLIDNSEIPQLLMHNLQSTTNHLQQSTVNNHLSTYAQPTTYNLQLTTVNYLLFAEHQPVYTLGKSGSIGNVLISKEEREQKKIEFFKINRGGDITFHGPGQLVGYPVIDLENFKTDLGWYLRQLEEVIILTLAEYAIKGERSKGETGVWIEPGIKGKERKICAMGIRCSRWITMHGFAFNINTNLDYFNYIIPCGIQNKQVTSLEKELGHEISMAEVKQKVKVNFAKVFKVELVEAETL